MNPQAPIQPGESPEYNKKKLNIKIIIGTVVILAILIPLSLFAYVYISFSGGIKGVINEFTPAPNPQSASLNNKRSHAKESINSSFANIQKITSFDYFATSVHDRCDKGQYNYKVKDNYTYRCTVRITKYYGFNGDFPSEIIGFENKIINDGWKPAYTGKHPIKEIIDEYYNKVRDNPNNYHDSTLVSGLPTPYSGYKKEDNALFVEYAERDSTDLSGLDFTQNVAFGTLDVIHDKKEFQNIPQVFGQITKKDKYVLAVSIQQDYFSN